MHCCPYCGCHAADSADHIFPRFLGGRRTVKACRSCNSVFGHTFEAKVARELEPLYVQLAKWGVPLSERQQWWRSAFKVEGALLDLGVGPNGVKARANQPIIERDANGEIAAAYFTNEDDLGRFWKMRPPDEQWVETQKTISTNLSNLRFSLNFGLAIKQLALKMSLAVSTRLPNFDAAERVRACEVLQSFSGDVHPLVSHYISSTDAASTGRPPLAHTVYVEHDGKCVKGIVEFFGAFRSFVELATTTGALGRDAVFAYLDPVEVREHSGPIATLCLIPPPPAYPLQEMAEHQVGMIQTFVAGAIARGAKGRPEIRLNLRFDNVRTSRE